MQFGLCYSSYDASEEHSIPRTRKREECVGAAPHLTRDALNSSLRRALASIAGTVSGQEQVERAGVTGYEVRVGPFSPKLKDCEYMQE